MRLATIAAIVFLFLAVTFGSIKAQSVNLPDVVACWDMEETSGTRYDSTSNNFDLTDNNTVGAVVGLVGNAASFIPANAERLTRAHNDMLGWDMTGHAYYVATNKGTSSSSHKAVMSKNHATVAGQGMYYNNGTLEFYLGADNVTAVGGPANGQWSHLFVWAASGVLYGQINQGSVFTTTSSYTSNTRTFEVGSYLDGAVYYDGQIDTFAIFSDALNSDTREWLYNVGSGRTCSEIMTGASDSETETVYFLDLPSGGVGSLEMKISAGEMIAALGIALVVMLLAYKQLSEMAKGSKPK